MVVWSGGGILVLVIACVGGGIGSVIAQEIAGEAHSYIGLGVGVMFSALPIWFIGKRMNNPTNAKVLIDPQTGQQVLVGHNKHTLFWIPMQWWSVPIPILGILALVLPH